MSQGLIGGATSYEEQSMNDILEDIKRWVEYTQEDCDYISKNIKYLKECSFWDKIPFNFQMTLLSTITCQKTFLEDFNIISEAIANDRVTQKEVNLLYKIGRKARDFNNEYGRTYKEERIWKKYGDKDFRVAEDSYAKGRDYFVTLQDASNASSRLEDYISVVPPVVNNSINQQITGNGNIVTGVNKGTMSITNEDKNKFSRECEEACLNINKLENVEQEIKNYITNLLKEAKEATEAKDEAKENLCKRNYKGFVIGAGVKAFKVIGVLSSFASIASFFGIQI